MNVANGYWLPLLRIAGVRSIVNVDGIEWERGKWSTLARRVFYVGAKLTARWADRLVFDSRAIEEYWKREFDRSGDFIPYGGEAFRATNGVSEFPKGEYILVVARLVPENSVREFLLSLRFMDVDIPVVIVGGGVKNDSYETELRELVAFDSRVHWLGHVSDDERLFSLWRDAGVYFHGHSVGGTNPALVQAMMLGARIVARDTVYNREVLGDAGLFTSTNPEEIAAAVQEMLSSEEDYGAEAERRAKAEYTWDIVCEGYLRSVQEALMAGGRLDRGAIS